MEANQSLVHMGIDHLHFLCSGAHGLTQKLYNWDTLNQKVFRRLGFLISKAEIEATANCEAGAIERILKLLRTKLEDKSSSNQRSVTLLLQGRAYICARLCAGALGEGLNPCGRGHRQADVPMPHVL